MLGIGSAAFNKFWSPSTCLWLLLFFTVVNKCLLQVLKLVFQLCLSPYNSNAYLNVNIVKCEILSIHSQVSIMYLLITSVNLTNEFVVMSFI